jgi:hypothetical protein
VHRPRGAPTHSGRHPERSEGSAPVDQMLRPGKAGLSMTERQGITPPIGYDRAREWICHVRGDCWCRSVLQTGNRNRLRNKASTTRSCTSDAEHEFSRTRSPGLHPMLSFRNPRCPQLLLMRPSLFCKGEVGGRQVHEAFS